MDGFALLSAVSLLRRHGAPRRVVWSVLLDERVAMRRAAVRRAAAVLGWTVIEDGSPSPPSSHPLIEKAAGLSTPKPEAETMWRFRVEVRGQNHVIGLPDTGILSVILHAVVRKLADGGREHECELSLGGLRSDGGHVDWAKYQLGIGDLVVVEILPKGPFDEPTRVRTEAQIAAALYDKQRDEVRERARALGWTLIEGDTPEVS
jgi:hypothetical protein